MRRVLMVAFQFPPFAGSSAVQRALHFARYLSDFGWTPMVLTAAPRAYDQTSPDLLRDIPPGVLVRRAFSLDAARDLSFRRRYPAAWARPDRWISWLPAAVCSGLALIRKHRPSALWSTFPIPTAHLIADRLHRATGIPWVADFRDPMVQPDDPSDPALWRSVERVEQRTLASASLNIFTTEGTRAMYRSRYSRLPPDRFAVVENGYDEEAFAGLASAIAVRRADEPRRLLHSGAIYPLERDPTALFRALQILRRAGLISPDRLRVTFRATGHDAAIRSMIDAAGVADLVEIAPPIAYRDALREMMNADGLLLLQAAQVRTQVPAKVYEYMRAGRPVIALTSPGSETARVLDEARIGHVARIDDEHDVARVLDGFLRSADAGSVPKPERAVVERASRRSRTGELAGLLERVVSAAREDAIR
jgi:glycosyltransferase involved in cell wall biosynthesis